MNGLRIAVDFNTGRRAGGINPRDAGLPCHPTWQDTDDGFEIRLIADGRDIDQYRALPGVDLLEGEDAIKDALSEVEVVIYSVTNDTLMSMSMQQQNIDLSTYDVYQDDQAIFEDLFNKGVLGILRKVRTPVSIEVVARTLVPQRKSQAGV